MLLLHPRHPPLPTCMGTETQSCPLEAELASLSEEAEGPGEQTASPSVQSSTAALLARWNL